MAHEYNGGSILAMRGEGCVGMIADRRLGMKFTKIDTNFQRVFKMQDNILLGLTGLATDVQTFHALMEYKLNMFRLRENRDMTCKSFAWLVASTLYEARFGPWMVGPVVCGMDDGVTMCAGYDSIGCLTWEDFIPGGTGSEFLLGAGETWWREGMNETVLEDAMINSMTGATDRDILSGFYAACYVMNDHKIDVKMVKLKQV